MSHPSYLTQIVELPREDSKSFLVSLELCPLLEFVSHLMVAKGLTREAGFISFTFLIDGCFHSIRLTINIRKISFSEFDGELIALHRPLRMM